jgi:recombination protein RecA
MAPGSRWETVPSGALTLDLALGGGLPKGRVVEIYGPESSGKTTVALHAVAEVQKRGGIAAFVDAEHALDPAYAEALGVDVQNLLVSQPDHGEAALEIVDSLVRSTAVDVIVVDSVAALVPKAEIEGDMGDSHMGLQARLMSQALRKITRQHQQNRLYRHFSQPNCGKKLAFPTATRKPPPAATPSSFTPRYGWIFAASRP